MRCLWWAPTPTRSTPEGIGPGRRAFATASGTTRFNTALALDAEGVRGIHHKSRLVIGVEKMPLPWLFDWLSFLIIDLGGTTGQLGVDTQRTVFAADGVRVAPAICYESVYGAYVGEFVRGGAQLLLVITNDGWWRDTAIHRQHFSFARLRAIEHRRAVARSANTGISWLHRRPRRRRRPHAGLG